MHSKRDNLNLIGIPLRWDENDLPFSPHFQDHYYSRNDGRAECSHVFLSGNGLPQRWQDHQHFIIGELGFGTGLNFLQTWDCWRKNRSAGQHLTFASIEGFPMDENSARRALARWAELTPLAEKLLAHWSGLFASPSPSPSPSIDLDAQTTLQVHHGLAENILSHALPNSDLPSSSDFPPNSDFPITDAWFLDGFAPSKNPDMWAPKVMNLVADHTHKGGTCASYTAAGWVRRNLEQAGFEMEKRKGFGTKRDMIAGYKP